MENCTKFPPGELRERMEAVVLGWVGRWCTFERGGKRRKAKIVGGEYKGMLGDTSQFELLVQGKSGRVARVDFRKDGVQVF